MRLGYNEGMSKKSRYPEFPTIDGALSRKTLAERAVREGYCSSEENATDYDILSAAVILNSKQSMELGLDLGFSPFSYDSTILNLIAYDNYDNASKTRTQELLETVLKHRNFDKKQFKEHSWELMSKTILSNNLPAFDLLIEAGANPHEITPMGTSVLHVACQGPASMDTMEQILVRYPDLINARDQDGGTPLIVAADRKKTPLAVYRLLEEGADPLAEDRGGLLHNMSWKQYQDDGLDLDKIVKELKVRISQENWEKLVRQDFQVIGLPVHAMAGENLTMDFTAVAPNGDVDTFKGDGRENDEGRVSALGISCLSDCRQSFRSLLRGGADLRKMTDQGHTCWHLWAIMSDKLEVLDSAGDYYNALVEHTKVKRARRLFLKSGISTEKLSDNGEHPAKYTDNADAKRFFAEQRRKALGEIPQGADKKKRIAM